MALPPEALQELIEQAERVVEATVERILEAGPSEPDAVHAPGWTGAIDAEPWQLVQLRVHRILLGPATSSIEAHKPRAPYLLAVGQQGNFILGAATRQSPAATILGRYGPATCTTDELRTALEDQS